MEALDFGCFVMIERVWSETDVAGNLMVPISIHFS
jgi:hypothetical protein